MFYNFIAGNLYFFNVKKWIHFEEDNDVEIVEDENLSILIQNAKTYGQTDRPVRRFFRDSYAVQVILASIMYQRLFLIYTSQGLNADTLKPSSIIHIVNVECYRGRQSLTCSCRHRAPCQAAAIVQRAFTNRFKPDEASHLCSKTLTTSSESFKSPSQCIFDPLGSESSGHSTGQSIILCDRSSQGKVNMLIAVQSCYYGIWATVRGTRI